jgi:rare lipoprotein A
MRKYLVQINLIGSFIMLSFTSALAQYYTYSEPQTQIESGLAMYCADYLHGQSTAMGEIYNKYEMTCSHSYHPKGTLLKVTRVDNGKSVTVRVNDKGAFSKDVVISLSLAAAMQIDLVKVGKSTVTVEPAGYSNLNPTNSNQEALVAREATLTKNYNDNKAYDKPVPLQSYDQLTPKGAGGATFRWNNTTPKSNIDVAAGNVMPTAYDMPSNTRITSVNNSGFGIQIGSYGVYDNADRQLANLRNVGITNAFVKESVTTNGGRLFRIMVGSFASRTAAQDYLQSLRNQLIADGIVVDLSK